MTLTSSLGDIVSGECAGDESGVEKPPQSSSAAGGGGEDDNCGSGGSFTTDLTVSLPPPPMMLSMLKREEPLGDLVLVVREEMSAFGEFVSRDLFSFDSFSCG